MKQLNKIILSLVIFMTYLFINTNHVLAEETLNCSYTLKNGSRGEQVKILQNELNQVMSCGLTADGAFGTKTKTCVISFQKQNSLTQDGIVGSKTCTKLNELYSNQNNNQEDNNQNSQIEESTTNEKTLNIRSKLSQGSKNTEQVKLLQTELNAVMNCGLTVDGAFGAKSKTCVQNFQKKYGLTTDGIVGIATAGKLNTVYLANNDYVIVNVSSVAEGGYLRVRAKATSSSTELGKTTYGTVYKVYGTAKDSSGTIWYKIKFNNQDAYISSEYTKKDAIVVDISEQTLKMYQNGKLTMDTAVITGTKSIIKYNTTLVRSTLKVSKKEEKRDLSVTNVDGSTGSSYVDYWMPFYGNIGFHDASFHYSDKKKENVGWRSNSEFYDVNTYINNGSHGCVNMLFEDAKTLYNTTTKDILVYVVE